MTRRCLLALLALILASAPTGGAATFRADVSAGWIDNLSRSASPLDQRDALRTEAQLSASWFRATRSGFLASLELAGGLTTVPDFSKAGALTVGPRVLLRQKFGLGAYAPAVELSAGLNRREARLDADEGWTSNAGLRLVKRLTPAWRLAVTGDWHQHDARQGTFDIRQRRLHATVTWDLSDRWQLNASGGRLWGEFTANASSGIWAQAISGGLGAAIEEYYNTIPWAVTDIYGPGWVTYPVAGRVDFWSLELAPALGRNTSLPLRYERANSLNRAGVRYSQESWSLGILHRF